MHLNCLPASLSVHHLVNIMIPSIALRSLCPLVISPGFLIHSFMSSTRCVPGRSPIGLSDPLRPPLPSPPRTLQKCPHCLSRSPHTCSAWNWELITYVDVYLHAGLCAYTYRHRYVLRRAGGPSQRRANLNNGGREQGMCSLLLKGSRRQKKSSGSKL